MKFNDNPYYSPEKCGLKIIDEIDNSGSYEYDKLVVWQKLDDKTIWYDTDSGCSCPSPFEDHGHELKQITKDTFYNFQQALKNHMDVTQEQINKTEALVKKLIKFKK